MIDFMDLFTDETEGNKEVAANPLPINTYCSYVDSSLLNAFINNVTIKRAWCLNRYSAMDDEYEGDANVMNPPESKEWVKLSSLAKTKRQAIEILNEKGRTFHVKVDVDFDDDVLILAKYENYSDEDPNIWFFFWYDRDNSDCCISRFIPEISEEELYSLFDDYAARDTEYLSVYEPPTLINLSYFSGWISS